MGPVKQYTDEPSRAVDAAVYPGADGRLQLYEDDGKSFDYRQGAVDARSTRSLGENAARRLTLSLAPGGRMLPPGTRNLEVVLAGQTAGKPVAFTGKPVDLSL